MILREEPAPAPAALVLIRLMVGAVFVSEGIQKFLFPAALGVGRFTNIGIPLPELSAPFVGIVEIVAGLLVILGLLMPIAAGLLLVDILVAIVTTKVPLLLKSGFWAAAHEARTDYCMFLGLVFLLVGGAGPWSFGSSTSRRRRRR